MENYNTKRNGVPVRIVETGEVFNSVKACADRLGASASQVSSVVRGARGLKTCRGYHIVAAESDSNVKLRKEYRGRPGTRVRVVETGEVFDSISDCAESMRGSIGSICDALHNSRNRTTYRGLHFESAD